jgi:hypothetical protein
MFGRIPVESLMRALREQPSGCATGCSRGTGGVSPERNGDVVLNTAGEPPYES